jgi:hypothetical protein
MSESEMRENNPLEKKIKPAEKAAAPKPNKNEENINYGD